MIRKANEREQAEREMFGGPGKALHTVLMTKDDIQGKGRVFNQVRLVPGAAIGKHTHTGDFEVYYILSGKGMYDDNGTEVEVGPGDVMLCRDGESHSLLNTGTENLELLAVVLFS